MRRISGFRYINDQDTFMTTGKLIFCDPVWVFNSYILDNNSTVNVSSKWYIVKIEREGRENTVTESMATKVKQRHFQGFRTVPESQTGFLVSFVMD
jgi:hypothetical protein